jgi:hypothetical protein
MSTRNLKGHFDESAESELDELSLEKQAKLVQKVFSDRLAFERWVIHHPRGFAAALGLCGAPQRYFERVANSVKQSRARRIADDIQEGDMAEKDKKPKFSGISELRENFPWDGLIDLLNGVRTARLMNEILIPLLGQTLELQNLTERAYRPTFRADLKAKLDRAANLARAGLSDIATQDIGTAKKRLKDLDKAIQTVRDSLEQP